MTEIKKTDVFISGGGPTGLLTAYALARQGVDTLFVGKDFLTLLCLLSFSKKQSFVNSFAQSNMTKLNRQCMAAQQLSTHARLNCWIN